MDSWGTVAGTLTAVATLITALGGLVVTLKVLVPNFRTNKETRARAEEINTQACEIHKIVNQQRTDMLRFQAALIKTLKAHDIDVPDDQSKVDVDGPR